VLPFIISCDSPYFLGIIDLYLLTLLLIGDWIGSRSPSTELVLSIVEVLRTFGEAEWACRRRSGVGA